MGIWVADLHSAGIGSGAFPSGPTLRTPYFASDLLRSSGILSRIDEIAST